MLTLDAYGQTMLISSSIFPLRKRTNHSNLCSLILPTNLFLAKALPRCSIN